MDRTFTVRAQGYAIADGEDAYGLRTIAMPVLDAMDEVCAGTSLTIRNERQEFHAFVSGTRVGLVYKTAELSAALQKIELAAEPARRRA